MPRERAGAPDGVRTAVWGTPRAPLTLAISNDGGRTWPVRRDLEAGDGYCLTNDSQQRRNRELSYPSIAQTPDGRVHVAFTYFRHAGRRGDAAVTGRSRVRVASGTPGGAASASGVMRPPIRLSPGRERHGVR